MKLNSIVLHLCFIVLCSSVFAQNTKVQTINQPKKIDSTGFEQATSAEKPIVKDSSNVMLLLSGGYCKPLGTESAMLDSSWGSKLMLKQDNIDNTLFGFGGDLSYTSLPDNTYKNAYITYFTTLPYVTATFPLYKSIMLQGKAGPGFTILYSKINNTSDSSLSMTLAGGGGVYGVIKAHYVLGIEGMYYYYFQIHASSMVTVCIYAGYMF